MGKFALILVILFGLGLLAGCGRNAALFGDETLIADTPVYRANHYFYTVPKPGSSAVHQLKADHELSPNIRPKTVIKHGDPVTIIVNRAYVPANLGKGKIDKTRDILVLMDVGPANKEEFIAVYYQRNVPADETLTFQNLPIYSLDSWNDQNPPRFRMRLVDVSAERNAQTRAMFDIVNQVGGAGVSLLASPAAGAAFSVASTAAKAALGNEKNQNLVDFEFYLFSQYQISQAGGVVLGTFRKGGLIVFGTPLEESKTAESRKAFWKQDFQFDFDTFRIESVKGQQTQDVASPYVLATVMTAETTISNLVKKRAQTIRTALENPVATVDVDFEFIRQEADRLAKSLAALEAREKFKSFPTNVSFQHFLTTANNGFSNLPGTEKHFMLSTLRQITGVTRSDTAAYQTWLTNCSTNYDFSQETRRFSPKPAPNAPAKSCL